MKKIDIAIFFNNLRGFEVYKFLRKEKKYNIDIYLSEKNLNKELLKKLKSYILVKKIDTNLINYIQKKKYFLNIAAGWPLKFPTSLINSATKGTINLHAGKLPEYRGGSPLNWQIIEGKRKIFISIIKMKKGIDTGPIYVQKSIKLKLSENISDLHKKVNSIYPLMTKKVIIDIIKNVEPIKQSKKKVRYLKQRKDSDGLIIWNKMNSTRVLNLVRALNNPYLGAFYFYNKQKLRVFKCKRVNIRRKSLNPGEAIHLKKNKIFKCKKGYIEILKEELSK